MPTTANQSLKNKLNQIILKNGFASNNYNSRFILTANIIVVSKDITSTAPPMHAYTFDINLYIGDGVSGTLFSTTSVQVKGVGQNETKAYTQAINNLKVESSELLTFIKSGKEKIIEYYNINCNTIIKESNLLATQNKYDEAIFNLISIPSACSQCYDKAIAEIGPLYKKMIDRDCKLKLTEATNIWNANQTLEAANQAGSLLSTIEPQSSCFNEVKQLNTKIANRVHEIDAREWKYKLKEQEQKSELIKAYRDVGVAFGNGQPKSVTYNVRGWW